ncbi:MAG: hypothetical protein AAF413_02410 [Patescibacteria group bacterium]
MPKLAITTTVKIALLVAVFAIFLIAAVNYQASTEDDSKAVYRSIRNLITSEQLVGTSSFDSNMGSLEYFYWLNTEHDSNSPFGGQIKISINDTGIDAYSDVSWCYVGGDVHASYNAVSMYIESDAPFEPDYSPILNRQLKLFEKGKEATETFSASSSQSAASKIESVYPAVFRSFPVGLGLDTSSEQELSEIYTITSSDVIIRDDVPLHRYTLEIDNKALNGLRLKLVQELELDNHFYTVFENPLNTHQIRIVVDKESEKIIEFTDSFNEWNALEYNLTPGADNYVCSEELDFTEGEFDQTVESILEAS